MESLLIWSFIVSFLVVLFITPYVIRYLKAIGLIVKDQNKKDKPLIPISGGISVLLGILFGSMLFIFIDTFFYGGVLNVTQFFAALLVIFLITLIGYADDSIIKADKSESIGINRWYKPLLTIIAAIPLVVINIGISSVVLPFFGQVEFGILFPLLLIPIGVVGASNMVNLLAGHNGLETGLGIIYLTSLGLFAYVNGSLLASVIALITVGALLAFYIYNKYPAKIFPGDSLTYLLGGVLATVALIGNIEKAAIIVSIPFFIELFLKIRGKVRVDSYGYYYNGKVKSKYNKIYSIPHIFMNGKYTEKQIVHFIFLIEIFFAVLIWFV
jgi:UDP-N-acetylglucosamine--dolichyl-phosphate N-acetylglucosaminephosphotransferase